MQKEPLKVRNYARNLQKSVVDGSCDQRFGSIDNFILQTMSGVISMGLTIKDQCLMLWWACVKYRDKWCQICGWTPAQPELLEAHHIYFRSHACWRVQYDTDFGVSLCHHEHQIAPYAPHQDKEKFLDLIIPRIQQDSPKRAAKILEFLNNPIEMCSEKADYHKIADGLRAELKLRKEHYEMDKYNHDEIWRGRPR